MSENHKWTARIYLADGKVKTVCADCGAIRNSQNRERNCQSPAPGGVFWNLLTAAERLRKRQETEEATP